MHATSAEVNPVGELVWPFYMEDLAFVAMHIQAESPLRIYSHQFHLVLHHTPVLTVEPDVVHISALVWNSEIFEIMINLIQHDIATDLAEQRTNRTTVIIRIDDGGGYPQGQVVLNRLRQKLFCDFVPDGLEVVAEIHFAYIPRAGKTP